LASGDNKGDNKLGPEAGLDLWPKRPQCNLIPNWETQQINKTKNQKRRGKMKTPHFTINPITHEDHYSSAAPGGRI
jgi:hypothetical protein